MGRGKVWTLHENLHLAEAWLQVSEDADEATVKGTNQDGDEFWKRVEVAFKEKTPSPNPEGQYQERSNPAIINQWKEKIARQARKFNASLMKVYRSNPTGCTEQNKINMAVAIYLKKTDKMDYTHKDFNPNNWPVYLAWEILKEHRAFQPPAQTETNTVSLLEEPAEDGTPGDGTPGDVAVAAPDGVSVLTEQDNFVTPLAKKSRSRGPGAGARKTKALAKEEEYRKKKAKVQEGLLDCQRKRTVAFDTYVTNHARTSAFKMALQAYNTFKDHDPVEAAVYKERMNAIMLNQTAGDEDTEHDSGMPSLSDTTGQTGV